MTVTKVELELDPVGFELEYLVKLVTPPFSNSSLQERIPERRRTEFWFQDCGKHAF